MSRFFGANAGIFAGEREGVTHQFFEDLGILRSVAGFK
jgi:transketolase